MFWIFFSTETVRISERPDKWRPDKWISTVLENGKIIIVFKFSKGKINILLTVTHNSYCADFDKRQRVDEQLKITFKHVL